MALIVTDMKKAKYFYSTVLGLTESDQRPNFPFPGAWYQIGSTQLHLIVHDEARTLRNTNEIDSKDGHFAIRVKDMSVVLERLEKYNCSFDSRPNSMTGWHQVFVTDPDGNIVELNM